MNRNPTIRDIAAELGIHFTTVGKALKDDPRIAERTRKRVKTQAEAMGYRPNPLVSALMAHKQSTTGNSNFGVIAVLIDSRLAFQFKSVDLTRRGVEKRAEELGFRVEYFPLDEYRQDLSTIRRVLMARGIACVLLFSLSASDVTNSELFGDFCCASVQEHFGSIPAVVSDHFQTTELLCERLHGAGFRRPALIISKSLDPMGMDRVVSAFRSLSADVFENEAAPILRESEVNESTLEAWLEKHRPDILIESWRGIRAPASEKEANPINHWLSRLRPDFAERERGFFERISKILRPYPRVLLDCIEPGEVGISQNRDLAARKAIDLLTAALNRNERGVVPVGYRLMVEGSWVGNLPRAPSKKT